LKDTQNLRALLLQERHGVLATLSARRDGWPFASAVPYALSEGGEPLFLLSELAEHTRNLRADARASLLVQDSLAAADPQAGARVTLLGTAEPHDTEASRHTYLGRHPQAAEYAALGDFKVWRLNVTEARYVGGFGEMGWLDGLALREALSE
jgi:heme oxygenase (biliverdin-IX-beta and delta-forming)